MIEYLEIEGFKSIKKLSLELKSINILIGSNGAGKSNFVSFFKLVDSLYRQQLARHVLSEKADNLLYFGRKTTESLRGNILFFENPDHQNAYWFQLMQDREGGLFIREEGYSTFINRNDPSNKSTTVTATDLPESKILAETGDGILSFVDYLSGIQLYHFHDTSATSRLRQACDIHDNEFVKTDGRNLPAFLYYLQERHPKLFGRLVKTIQSIAPYIDRFILEPSRLNPNEIALRWVEKGDPNSNFGAYQFSDGTLRFIALATVLMQPNPPSVIIIDEPELGLHPQAIVKLAGLIQLAANKIQLILSTQSVSLVNCFEAEDVITVDRNETENQSVFQRLDSEKLGDWLNEHALGDLWERNIINSAQPYLR